MSLKAIIDFGIHLESFRNIDLVNQGVYRFKVRIHQELKEKKLFAHPYFTTECYKNGPVLSSAVNKPSDSKMTYAHINDESSAYFTRSFLIRFCEEEVELNEICHFQAEVDALPDFSTSVFYVVVELIHSTYTNVTTKSDKKDTESNTTGGVQVDLKTLETFTGKITLSKTGVHEYVPIIFDNINFSLLSATFHSTVLDFRFRVDTSSFLLTDSNGNELNKEKGEQDDFRSQPKTFGEYVKKNFKSVSYERLSETFTTVLKDNYENLLSFYNDISNKCLLDSHKKKYKSLLQPPMKLIIPDIWKASHGEEHKENDKIKDKDIENLASCVLNEINFIAGELLYLWFKLMELVKITPRFVLEVLKYDYNRKLRERWGESFIRQVVKANDFSVGGVSKAGEKHAAIATKKRKNLNYDKHEPLYCEDINMIPTPDSQPILFEHIYLKETKENLTDATDLEASTLESDSSPYKGIHLIVLVHGFQGNSFDMKLIKNNLSMLHPEALILCSSSNEDNTETDIADMGLKLANEVKNFISETCPSSFIGRISFVVYSLGGVIARASFPHLEEYADKFHTFFSLSSPHLGYMYSANKIVEAGLWFLKKWRKSACLAQLSLADTTNPEDGFLYKLSSAQGLNWFKNVGFVSSWQDQYAPFESARVEVCPEALTDSTKGAFYRKMTKNILGQLTTNNLYRIDVNFKITESNLDTMIGRAAHIRFLESQSLIRMILYRYDHFFA